MLLGSKLPNFFPISSYFTSLRGVHITVGRAGIHNHATSIIVSYYLLSGSSHTHEHMLFRV